METQSQKGGGGQQLETACLFYMSLFQRCGERQYHWQEHFTIVFNWKTSLATAFPPQPCKCRNGGEKTHFYFSPVPVAVWTEMQEELAILFCIISLQPPGLSVESLLSFLFLLTLHSFRWLRSDSHTGFVVSRVTWTAKFIIQRPVPKGKPPDELESARSTELPQGAWMDRDVNREAHFGLLNGPCYCPQLGPSATSLWRECHTTVSLDGPEATASSWQRFQPKLT